MIAGNLDRASTPAGPLAGIVTWWEASARELPWRATRDVYAVWVAEVMSAQTTVGRAAEAWSRWMARWPTVEALAGASLAEVLGQWQGLGYPRRGRDLHRGARIVAAGGWPEDLTALPGVGPYIAAAIRCFAREEPVLPLDVNVTRVLARRFGGELDAVSDGEVEAWRADPWRAGQALMEFGQRICRARPLCGECPVAAGCPAGDPVGAGALGSERSGALGSERSAARDAVAPRRSSRPFAGSVRQRRGRLLRAVLADGPSRVAPQDAEAAAGLAADGLAVLEGGLLHPPRDPA